MDDVQNDQPADTKQHESFGRHPIHATVEEATHLREVADEGESASTPVIIAGVVFASVVALAGTFILLAFVVMHFA